METLQGVQEIFDLSPHPCVRVFRSTLFGLEDFESMEVDAYVVLGEQYAVLLDTLLCPADTAQIMNAIEPLLPTRQLLCVNSHADWDHTWGNGYFRHKGSPPILAHEMCRQRMLSQEACQELEDYQQRHQVFRDVVLLPPSLTFRESFTIHDPLWSMELLHAPGHCQDQIVAWLPELHLLLAFDAVEKPLPYIQDVSTVQLMISTLERLAALKARTALCSHGGTTSPALIGENLAYFHEIRRRAERYLTSGRPTGDDLADPTALIGYPVDEALAGVGEDVDRTFYGRVHEHNVGVILQWLMVE